MIAEPKGATMNYLIKVSVDPDRLRQTYADAQGIPIEECDLDVQETLENEMGWLDSSGVAVIEIHEVHK